MLLINRKDENFLKSVNFQNFFPKERKFHGFVVRNPKLPKAPGVFYLFEQDESFIRLIDSWNVITGPEKVTPAEEYGGCTPPLNYFLCQPFMKYRINESKPLMTQAIFVPADDAYHLYPKRTFYRFTVDPYRLHPMGSSTGCIGPEKKSEAESFVEVISEKYREEPFGFSVLDHVS